MVPLQAVTAQDLPLSDTDWGALLVGLCRALVETNPGLTVQVAQIGNQKAIVRQYGDRQPMRTVTLPAGLLRIVGEESGGTELTVAWNQPNLHLVDEQSPFCSSKLEQKAMRALLRLDAPDSSVFVSLYHQQSLADIGLGGEALVQLRDAAYAHLDAEKLVIPLLENLARSLRVPLAIVDKDRKTIYVNKQHEQLFGYELTDIVGKPISLLRSHKHNKAFYEKMWSKALSGMWSGQLWHKRKNGDYFYSSQTIISIHSRDGVATHFGIMQQDPLAIPFFDGDLVDHKLDKLTGLLNSQYFLKASQIKIDTTRVDDEKIGLLVVNVNNFTEINELLGTDGGDRLLVKFAELIALHTRDTDLTGRLFGDEFAVLYSSGDIKSTMERIAHDIEDGLQRPFVVEGQEVFVSASLGIAICPEDGKNIRTLLNHASDAVKRCEKTHKSQHLFYHKETQARSVHSSRMKGLLLKALNNKQIRPHYQPILNIQTGAVEKVEVLARWQTSQKKFVSPMEFIPVAQQYGLMAELGDLVFSQVLDDILAVNRVRAAPDLVFNINKSIPEFQGGKAIEIWHKLVAVRNVSSSQITIEVTEDVAVSDQKDLSRWLRELHVREFGTAIDDFGTGYASLSYLVNNPFDCLKIDRMFVDSLQEEKSLTLVKTMIRMAHELKMKVVAEGIETEGQLRLLSHLGCDYAQGFYLYRPMPLSDLLALFNEAQLT